MSLALHQDNTIAELDQTQALCKKLMQTPHYAKIGEAGIYAIIIKAKSMGLNPLDALNGGMYSVQGKVEMSGQSMLALIRSKGHSISMDPKSTDTKVIMYGKRCDNNDTWRAEFSVEDAKRQGIYRNQWEKQSRIMCQWRCVSQLGRFLFSDVIKGVYVHGEIADAPAFDAPVNYVEPIKDEPIQELKLVICSKQQAEMLQELLLGCSPDFQNKVMGYMKNQNINNFESMPLDSYNKIFEKAKDDNKKYNLEGVKIEEVKETIDYTQFEDEVEDDKS